MLDLTDDILNNVSLSYKDEEGDKNEIKTFEDYKYFIKNIKERNDLVILSVEIKDESDFNIKKMSSSIIAYKDKKNSNDINDNIKKNSLELSNEIINNMNNISMNENYQNNNNINNNINNNLYNNHSINNNQMNNLYNNNNLMNNNNNNQMNIRNNNYQNIQNQINNNNQMNIRNNNYQNIQNQINNNIFQNSYQQNIAFICPFPCLFCNNSPISEIVYYCPNCNNVFCKRSELKAGPKHNHAYYQIKNNSQYNYLHLNEKIKIKNILTGFGNKVQGAYNNMVNFLKNDYSINNDMNNNRNNIQMDNNQESYLINIARNSYDLRNISDQQIKEALRKTNGNIDNAVILLTVNNNNIN